MSPSDIGYVCEPDGEWYVMLSEGSIHKIGVRDSWSEESCEDGEQLTD